MLSNCVPNQTHEVNVLMRPGQDFSVAQYPSRQLPQFELPKSDYIDSPSRLEVYGPFILFQTSVCRLLGLTPAHHEVHRNNCGTGTRRRSRSSSTHYGQAPEQLDVQRTTAREL